MIAANPTCRVCGAPIRWVRTGSGSWMPLNLRPDPAGNVVIAYGEAIVLPPRATRPAGRYVFMPHHAACPSADVEQEEEGGAMPHGL